MTVLTNAKGFTVYSFARHVHQVQLQRGVRPGLAAGEADVGVRGQGPVHDDHAIQRCPQLAFHGHPLYTFTGDTAPGQAKGNGVNAFGGLWHEAPVSGGAAPASSSTSGTGGGGY